MTIEIAPMATISSLADIEASVRNTRFMIGDQSVIDSFVKVKPVGGTGDIVIGARTIINSGCVLYSGNGLRIGDDVAIAANCVLAPTNHAYETRDLPIRAQRFKESRGGIVIEDDVWIGAGCVILDGAVIGRGCVIGVMPLVRGRCEPYGVYAGNRLRLMGQRR